MKPSKPHELFSIQYLRGVAALMVVLFHGFSSAARDGAPEIRADWLSYGVDIFFVISGCIMWITTVERPIGPLKFYWKRFVRIAPLYWLITGVLAAVVLVAPSLFRTARFVPSHIAASFLFLPHQHPTRPTLEPLLTQGWTLNYEMFFYLLFGLALMIGSRRLRFWTVIGALAALAAVGLAIRSGPILEFYTSPYLLEFAFGIGLAELFLRGRLQLRFGGLAMAVGFALIPALALLAPQAPHVLATGLPAALIVGGALSLEARGGVRSIPALHLMGDASYSIYLSNPLVMSVMVALLRPFWVPRTLVDVFVYDIAGLVVCAAAGVVIYRLVERPLVGIRFGRRGRGAATPALAPSLRGPGAEAAVPEEGG